MLPLADFQAPRFGLTRGPNLSDTLELEKVSKLTTDAEQRRFESYVEEDTTPPGREIADAGDCVSLPRPALSAPAVADIHRRLLPNTYVWRVDGWVSVQELRPDLRVNSSLKTCLGKRRLKEC